MRTLLITFYSILFAIPVIAQDLFISQNAKISFYSKAPMEDIDAHTSSAVTALNFKTGQVYFKVKNTSFEFKQKLMQEHFNENYMESEKYPYSEFKGSFQEKIDLTKSGKYQIEVKGKLNMHGVTKDYTIPVTIVNTNGSISASTQFKTALKDHKIEVPTIVFSKIAEEIDVKVSADYKESNIADSGK